MTDILRQSPLLVDLSDDDWSALSPRLQYVDVVKGDVVFCEDDPGDRLFVLTHGKMKITRSGPDDRENLLAVLGPGDLLGELSLFDSLPRTATATALTATTLASLSGPDFHDFLSERPRVGVRLLKVLAGRLRDTNAAMADLIFTDVPGRVAKAILSLAERFGAETDEGLRVTHDLTQEELAQLVGASRETVNKALNDFAGRGWLRLDGKTVVVFDVARLTQRCR